MCMLPCCTIADLKSHLEGRYGMKSCDQRLISEGKQLEDVKTLKECNVASGSTVQLVARLRGGAEGYKPQLQFASNPHKLRSVGRPSVRTASTGHFFDMENTGSVTKIRLTKNAALWRACVEGLNVEGNCLNGECEAFGQMVICGLGFTVFNVAEECQCTICRETFVPITCGFWKCTWMFEGRKRAGNIDMMSPWFDAGIHYESFDEGEAHRNMTDLRNLIIAAKEARIGSGRLHKRKSRKGSEFGKERCAICFENFTLDDDGISLKNCEHVFHSECIGPWLTKGTSCPSCRNPLVQ